MAEEILYRLTVKDDGTPAMEKFRKSTENASKSMGGFSKFSDIASGATNKLGFNVAALANPYVLAGAAIAGTGIALGKITMDAINFSDSLNDMHDKTGLSVETLSRLQPVAELGGTSLENLVGIYGKFNAKVASGDKDIRSLGITTTDASQAMIQVSQKMSEATNQTDKIAIAQKAYGKSWQEMMPILQAGPEAINKQMSGAALVTEEMAQKSAEFKDSLTEIKAPLTEIGLKIGNAVLPYMTEWAGYVKQIFDGVNDTLGLTDKFKAGLGGISTSALGTAHENKLKEIGKAQDELQAKRDKYKNSSRVGNEVTEAQEKVNRLTQEAIKIQDEIDRRKKDKGKGGDSSGDSSGGSSSKPPKTPKQWEVTTNDAEVKARENLRKQLEQSEWNQKVREEEIALAKLDKQKELAEQHKEIEQSLLDSRQEFLVQSGEMTQEALNREREARELAKTEAIKDEQEKQNAILAIKGKYALEDERLKYENNQKAKEKAKQELEEMTQKVNQATNTIAGIGFKPLDDIFGRMAKRTEEQGNAFEKMGMQGAMVMWDLTKQIIAAESAKMIASLISSKTVATNVIADQTAIGAAAAPAAAATSISTFGGAAIAGGLAIASTMALMAASMNAFADGTNYAPGGFAKVGERGPEIAYIPKGTKISTARESANRSVVINVNGTTLNRRELVNTLSTVIPRATRESERRGYR